MNETRFRSALRLTAAVAAVALLIAGWALYAHFDRTSAERAALRHNYQVTCRADQEVRETLRAVLIVRIHDPGTRLEVRDAFRRLVHRLDGLPATCLPFH